MQPTCKGVNEEHQDSEVQQSVILEVLGLDQSQKGQATNAVKQAFPNSLVLRKGKERTTIHTNLAKKGIHLSVNHMHQLWNVVP
jgi:hypothetical protein